ncbi:DUF2254 domain-containing protein [Planctomonas psychrotolerans]|uniref:DUF2254 domain-containing protein n=1 Tax=Planctomonas psychrotolerans TaxID=2528712 RepID=UPI00123AA32B|nr:DUF2254 domain-containing protein [Planctomonas psychrotolerans]
MIRTWLLRARESFWLMPAVFGISAVLLAEALIALDRVLVDADVSIPFLNAMSAGGGREMLSAVGITMLTVAGTAFSITISVLATTSSTYGPRLVRNFMKDRGNQLVLAVLTSTFLYSVVVLRSVRTELDDSQAFVPVLAVHFVVLLAMLDVAVLVFFIHHIASSVQVTTLQQRVQEEFTTVVDTLYPADGPVGDAARTFMDPPDRSGDFRHVGSGNTGYVQHMNLDRLVALAIEHDLLIDVAAMPGDHVIAGEHVAKIRRGSGAARGSHGDPEEIDEAVRSAFTIGNARTPHQDVRFALQQLTETAVRGLASGANDPYTATGAIDVMAEGLVPLCRRKPAADTRTDEHGVPRVVCDWPRAESLVATVFRDFRQYGLDHLGVMHSVLGLAERIERGTDRPAVRAALLGEVQALREAFLARDPADLDRAPIETRIAELVDALRTHPVAAP